MSDATDWTIVLSGPLAQRGPLLASLDRAGVSLSDSTHSRGLPDHATVDDDHPASDPTVGWINARHADIDEAGSLAANAGWALRMHYPTPRCTVCLGGGQVNGDKGLAACLHCEGTGRTEKPAPTPDEQLAAVIAQMRAEIAALKTKGA